MGGDVTVYTLLSTCPVVNRYILNVYHLFSCYHLFLVGVNYLKWILFISWSKPYQRASAMFMCVLSSIWAPKAFRRVSLYKGFPFLDFTRILSNKHYYAWTRPFYRSQVEAWRSGNPGCLFPMELPNPRWRALHKTTCYRVSTIFYIPWGKPFT